MIDWVIGFRVVVGGMKKLSGLLLALFAVSVCGCDDDHADELRALTGSGFTAVKFTGYVWAACSDGDLTHAGFTAKGPTGVLVSGTVCCAPLKGCTVRF